MSNDKHGAAYHGAPGDDQVGRGGFRDVGNEGWATPPPKAARDDWYDLRKAGESVGWHHEYGTPLKKPRRSFKDILGDVVVGVVIVLVCLVAVGALVSAVGGVWWLAGKVWGW